MIITLERDGDFDFNDNVEQFLEITDGSLRTLSGFSNSTYGLAAYTQDIGASDSCAITMPIIGTIANADSSLTTQREIELLDKIKENTSSRDDNDNKDRTEAFRAAHFICVKHNVAIPIQDRHAIDLHKSRCSYQQQILEQKKLDNEMFKEGGSSMGGALCQLETYSAKSRTISRKEEPWKYEYCQKKIYEAWTIIRELLNHEHPRKRESATMRWNEYEQMTPKQKEVRYCKLEQIEE
jgi:hypothetical protein